MNFIILLLTSINYKNAHKVIRLYLFSTSRNHTYIQVIHIFIEKRQLL